MNLLTIENLTKVFTERKIFDQTDFALQEGDKVGVIGVNGTGKSTLLRIVAGYETPDEGTVTRGRQVMIRFLGQNPPVKEEQTVLEAAMDGNQTKFNQWTLESEASAMLGKLKITDGQQKMGVLSGGQKKRVALVNVLLYPADILVLDEPTNHLDNEMAEWLEGYLRSYKGALLMVTHDRYFLERVSNRIIELDQGKIYSYPGEYSEYLRLKEARQNIAIATERKRQNILRTELEWLARGARARSTKQKAHISRIEEMKIQKSPTEDAVVEMSSAASRLGRKTIEVKGVSKKYGNKVLVKDYSYLFLRGERIGIIGENGCGKSTLMKMIAGEIKPDAGTIEIGPTVKIGYFAQETGTLKDSVRVIDYIKEVGEYVQTGEGKITASQMLERFLFDGTMQWNLIGKLSGGEKRRLYLLRILMGAPNVLMLDEPTNDLDIQTLTILEDYLDHFNGIVITISHDRYFLDRVVQRIFAFEEGGVLRQYEGGYSDYLAAYQSRCPRPEQEQGGITSKEKSDKNLKVREKKVKFSYQEEREYAVIDEEIERLERKIDGIIKEIESSASNYMKLGELMEEKNKVEQLLEEKLERWEYLNELEERIALERTGDK